MLIDACRMLLRMLPCAYVSMLIWLYVPELTTCGDMSLPTASVSTDLRVARERAARGSYYHAAAIVDVFSMMTIILASSKRAGYHDLRGYSRWVPVLMLSSGIAFRARYTHCVPNDPECCDGLGCPTTSYSVDLAGCAAQGPVDSFYIDWHDRNNWCALPRWYQTTNAASLCGGLQNTPDVSSCYRYGCSALAPTRYYGARMLIWCSTLFAIMALVPYAPLVASTPRVQRRPPSLVPLGQGLHVKGA